MPSTRGSSSTEPTGGERSRPTRRRFLRATGLAFAGALSGFAGCLDEREPSDPEAVDAVEASLDALAAVEGYTGDVGGRVEADANGDSIGTSLDGEQRVDETSRRAHALVEADDEREEVYVDDGTVYELCDFSRYVNVEEAWYPAETDVDWAAATLLGSQEALLEMSEVYDRGTESVDGRQARVIEFAPDPDEFDRYQRRARVAGEDPAPPEDVTVTQWLVENRPIRVRSSVERSASRATIEEDVRYDVTYGPVSIDLPPIVDDRDGCPEP